MNISERNTLLRVREKLSETISHTKTLGGLKVNCVVVNTTGALLNGRSGTFDKNITEALLVSPDFDPSLIGGAEVLPVEEACEAIVGALEMELDALDTILFPTTPRGI